MPDASLLNWEPEEFRRRGYQAVDALVDHWAHLRELPVRRAPSRAEAEERFAGPFPEDSRPFDDVFREAVEEILPQSARVSHPRFFGFVPGPSNPAGVLAEFLAAGFNHFAGTWMGGGVSAVIERRVVRWLCDEVGLGPRAGGLMVSGGSIANLTCLVLACERHPHGRDPRAVAYFSDQTHSASERALRALGFTPERLRKLTSVPAGVLEIDALRKAVQADVAAGLRPFCVISNAGTVGTGAVDPLPEITGFCRESGLWHHADAAYGGGAVISERGKTALKGLELADSMALDPHKWLFQPFDIGCVLVRDEQELVDVFRIIPAYMNDVYRMEADINFCDRGLELTRPFRALKLWMSLQHFGLAAFRAAVTRGFELAEEAESMLRADQRWEILTPARMAIVTFRREGDDALQKRLVDEINAGGHALLTSTTVAGRAALRLCTINPRTALEDIQSTIGKLASLASAP